MRKAPTSKEGHPFPSPPLGNAGGGKRGGKKRRKRGGVCWQRRWTKMGLNINFLNTRLNVKGGGEKKGKERKGYDRGRKKTILTTMYLEEEGKKGGL